MDEKPLTGSDMGVPGGSLLNRHLYSYYHVLDEICAYISRTDGSLDGKKLSTMVRFVISTIPDMDQGNRCIRMFTTAKDEEIKQITAARNHPAATQEDIRDATISACMTTLQLIQQIMNEMYGIQHLNDFGDF